MAAFRGILCALLLVACSSDPGTGDDEVAADGAPVTGADAAPASPDAPPVIIPDADPAAPDADPTADPRVGVVECDGATCDLGAGEVCCISISGSQCTLEDDCGGGFAAPQHCDGPEDCETGIRCCAVFSFGGEVGSFCRAACDTSESGEEAEICHDDAQCPDTGDTCRACEFPGAPTATYACAGNDIPACQN